MFYPNFIRLFGTMGEVIHENPAVSWWALDHLVMILSWALIQKKISHE